ncbi:protein phosphatase 2C domain-containing protein [Nonomuraea jiangxiensis]|uniref:Protein phosphatase 2C n=1 Tax=Nonomuraea jiangxiensis TaxID=633440 RepID=A0A1G9RQU8_9ACTN|nr:protein phosphatase 2C domain-containing protein [Nonomuraea jiangxiensis]SDM25337.1 Protein phosphatase 2C [Nonomuraea jiangxiensis]
MRASISSYHLHKGGGTEDEYEDAFATTHEAQVPKDIAANGLGIAISDGASESILAGRWARLLVRHFIAAIPEVLDARDVFAHYAVQATERWEVLIGEYIAGRAAEGRPIQWYEQPKMDRGAFATLLVVSLSVTPQDDGGSLATWVAAGIGDCALFHVRDNRLITSFPMNDPSEFTSSPDLLNSKNHDRELIAERMKTHVGILRQKDDLYICTDAVAAWFLEQAERQGHPWEILNLLDATDGPTFADLVDEERASGRMRNDDSTLIHVTVW